MTRMRAHDGRPEGRPERTAALTEATARASAARSCAGAPQEAPTDALDGGQVDPMLRDLPDVGDLLARMIDERIPLALLADLINPQGPDSDWLVASERPDVG